MPAARTLRLIIPLACCLAVAGCNESADPLAPEPQGVESQELSAPAGALPAVFDQNDPATWGRAHIYSPSVLASLNPGESFALAEMYHDGQVGIVKLSFQLTRLDGSMLQPYGPSEVKRYNIHAPRIRQHVHNSVQIHPPFTCGQNLVAQGEFVSYNLIIPLPIDLPVIDIPMLAGSKDQVSGANVSTQSPCPGPDGGGSGGTPPGGGGGGGGYYVAYSYCWGFDVYSDGRYVYSVVQGCSSYSVYINGGENQT